MKRMHPLINNKRNYISCNQNRMRHVGGALSLENPISKLSQGKGIPLIYKKNINSSYYGHSKKSQL